MCTAMSYFVATTPPDGIVMEERSETVAVPDEPEKSMFNLFSIGRVIHALVQ